MFSCLLCFIVPLCYLADLATIKYTYSYIHHRCPVLSTTDDWLVAYCLFVAFGDGGRSCGQTVQVHTLGKVPLFWRFSNFVKHNIAQAKGNLCAKNQLAQFSHFDTMPAHDRHRHHGAGKWNIDAIGNRGRVNGPGLCDSLAHAGVS